MDSMHKVSGQAIPLVSVKRVRMGRRCFMGHVVKTAAASLAMPLILPSRARGGESANGKLNIACIGLGNQIQGLMRDAASQGQNIVALCDVDTGRIAATRQGQGAPVEKATAYEDYRHLLEKEKSVDAVIIATPDHWHAKICTAAIQAGKHVYCEKPLTHTVGEARALGALAKRSSVVTQTGNQGSASENFRRSMELIQAGVFGEIKQVHMWHPPHGWPNGVNRQPGEDPVPAGLDWNAWIGPAPMRPYKSGQYHQVNWRGWYDFGGGSLADFCCHAFSMPVRALELDYPEKISVSGKQMGMESFPVSCQVRFQFPASGKRGPVEIFFYSGGEMPPAEVTAGLSETFGNVGGTGCILVGQKGNLSAGLWNDACYVKMEGEPKFRGADKHEAAKAIPQTLPRASGSHVREWVDACKGGPPTFSPFVIGGHITEIGAAGVIALRANHEIKWNGAAMTSPGFPEADAMVRPQSRVT
ncbi:MAG: Gfo/Idh/MocA family oxidoreductase [bacterium]